MSNNKGEQLNLDFVDDNMSAGCPTITIDSMTDMISLGDDTITLGSGTYDLNQLNMNWPYNPLGNAIGGATITGAIGNMNPWVTTTNNTGGYTITSTGTGYSDLTYNNPTTKGSLQVNGDAHFDGEVTIKGKNIAELFEKIEQRLAILHPNEKLEEKWEELKALGDAYRKLEAEIIEKQKMWDILKK